MSMWTHVIGAIHIDTYKMIDRDELVAELQEMVRNAPAITGSESNCQVEIAIEDGYDTFVSYDCRRCEYGPEELCEEPPAGYECQSGEYQTRAIITLCGDLRDRRIDTTAEEVNAFVDWVEEHFDIRNISIKIEDETEEIIRW